MKNRPLFRPAFVWFLLLGVAVARPFADPAGQGATSKGNDGDSVTVEFRARTDGGSPVSDLKASEVVIKVAGRERTIDKFQLFHFGEASSTSKLAVPFATNVLPASGIHDTIILIDDQSIAPGDEKRLGPAIDQYMAGLEPSARVGLVTIQDRGLNVSLTPDRAAVRAGVKALVGRAPASASADDAACRTRRALDALRSVAGNFPPGGPPASVLFFTTGLTAPGTAQMSAIGGARSSVASPVCEVQSRDYLGFQQALFASATDLHVVEAALAPSQPMRAGLEMLAGVSGNKLTEVVSGVEGGLAGLANVRGWYRATFVPERGERTGDLQRVEVESKRAGVRTEAHSQVLIPRAVSTTQPRSPQALLREARASHDLELRAAAFFSQEPGSDKVKVLVLFEPIESGTKVAGASMALYDAADKLTVQGSADASVLARSPSTLAVLASPGKYRLRVAAIDDRGRAGTVDAAIEVGLVPAGPLKLATLIPGVQDGGFSGRLLFEGTDSAMAYVSVYGTPATGQLTAQLEITDETGENLGAVPTQILNAPDGSRVIVGGLRLAAMAAGDYQMKMVVSLDGQVVGQTSHTFRRR